MKKPPHALLCWSLSALLLGCVSVEKDFPDKRYFVISASRQSAPRATKAGTTLKLRGLRISPRYEGAEIVTRSGELSYESDFYNNFFAAPAVLLSEEVYGWFSSAGLFENVVDAGSYLDATHTLDGAITALYGDYSGSGSAVLELQFFLIREGGERSRIVFKKDYRQSVSVADKDAASLVKAWSQALSTILTELEADIAKADLTLSE